MLSFRLEYYTVKTVKIKMGIIYYLILRYLKSVTKNEITIFQLTKKYYDILATQKKN